MQENGSLQNEEAHWGWRPILVWKKALSEKQHFYVFVQLWLQWRLECSVPMLEQIRITENQNVTEAVNHIWLEYVLYYTVYSRDTLFPLQISYFWTRYWKEMHSIYKHTATVKKAAVTSHGSCDKLRILGGHMPQKRQESHTIDFSDFSLCRASTMWQLIWKQNQKWVQRTLLIEVTCMEWKS